MSLVNIYICGIYGAGKKTIVHVAKHGKLLTTHIRSTIGADFEQLKIGNVILAAWLPGGRSSYRPLSQFYHRIAKGFIFVIDSNDRERIDRAREELHEMKDEGKFDENPLLIFANKQDLPNAMSIDEIRDKLSLNDFDEKIIWHLQSASAFENKGIQEGLEWLANNIVISNEVVEPVVETINDSVIMKNDIVSIFNLKNFKEKFRKCIDFISFLLYIK